MQKSSAFMIIKIISGNRQIKTIDNRTKKGGCDKQGNNIARKDSCIDPECNFELNLVELKHGLKEWVLKNS